MKIKHLCLGFAIACMALLATPAHAAMVAAADHSGGYSNSVLDAVVKKWHPPMDGTERTTRILVMIDGDGQVEECAPLSESGSEASEKAACDAVNSIGKFATPPYGLPMDVFLSFWVGKTEVSPAGASAPITPAPKGKIIPNPPIAETAKGTAQSTAAVKPADESKAAAPTKTAAPKANTTHKPTIQDNRSGAVMDEQDYYVKMVMRKIGPHVEFPPNLPQGELSTSLTVNVDPNGNMKDIKLSQSSGSKELDDAILKAAQKTGKVNPPPNYKEKELFLTFIIKNN